MTRVETVVMELGQRDRHDPRPRWFHTDPTPHQGLFRQPDWMQALSTHTWVAIVTKVGHDLGMTLVHVEIRSSGPDYINLPPAAFQPLRNVRILVFQREVPA